MAKKHTATSSEYRANSKVNGLFLGILFVIFGAVTVVCGQGMLDIVVTITGALFVLFGVLTFLETKSTESCLFTLVIGIVFLVLGLMGLASDIIRSVFGLMILLSGVFTILGNSPNFAGTVSIDTKVRTINIFIGAVLIVLGIIAMINYGGSFDILIRVIGAIILVMGALKIAKSMDLLKN